MKTLVCLVMVSVSTVPAAAQGQVNINNRSLSPAQPVLDSSGVPLVGTSFVAQIVYGAVGSMPSTVLGDLARFRVATTGSPGTWNPLNGTGVRTLSGFGTGSEVAMQVRVWDSAVFSVWDQASAALSTLSSTVSTQVGSSEVFTYSVGSAMDPSAQFISNFRGFQLTAIEGTGGGGSGTGGGGTGTGGGGTGTGGGGTGTGGGGPGTGTGQVNINNRGLPTTQLVNSVGGAPLVGTNFVAEIVYGASAGSLTAVLGAVAPFRVSTTASPGTWNPLGGTGVRTLTGFNTGDAVSMQVHVWDSTVFSSWSAAVAALAEGGGPISTQAGASAVFTYTVGSASDPSSLNIVNFTGFSLTAISQAAVPEPPAITLCALGVAALLWSRRK
jgi:hypothetical protein